MRNILVAIVISCYLFVFSSCTFRSTVTPNIVFILVDDLGWADIQCNNPGSFYDTPHINRLAEDGVRFTNAYAASPVCSPTRASIMTGSYPARLHITDWIPGMDPKDRMLLGPEDKHELPLEERSVAEKLKEAGYTTGFFGKWHLGGSGYYPENQGFDVNIGGYEKGSPPGGYYSPYNNPKLIDGPEGEYLPDRLTDETIRFIEEHREESFFACLAFYTVHTPIQACKRHLSKYTTKKESLVRPDTIEFTEERNGFTKIYQDRPDYASMVYAMDENVGRLVDRINQLGIKDRTYIIFTSDNGGLSTTGNKNAPTSNRPLRAGKGWCYEGGIRIPLIMDGPGLTKRGAIKDYPVITNDLFYTMLEMAGIGLNKNLADDGVSLFPILTGQADKMTREDLFWHFPHYHGSTWAPGSAVRSSNWKMIRFYEEGKSELYNLSSDPGEKTNLYDAFPEKAREMEMKLDEWLKETNAQMPLPNPGYY